MVTARKLSKYISSKEVYDLHPAVNMEKVRTNLRKKWLYFDASPKRHWAVVQLLQNSNKFELVVDLNQSALDESLLDNDNDKVLPYLYYLPEACVPLMDSIELHLLIIARAL